MLGQQVAQLDLERGRQHLVVGGPLLRVENERLGDLVTLPVGSDHVVLLQVGKHEGPDIGVGTQGSVVARGIDAGTLEEALINYTGSLITVSHDRWFLEQVVNCIWELQDGVVAVYYGNYTDYVRAKKGLPPLAEGEISDV